MPWTPRPAGSSSPATSVSPVSRARTTSPCGTRPPGSEPGMLRSAGRWLVRPADRCLMRRAVSFIEVTSARMRLIRRRSSASCVRAHTMPGAVEEVVMADPGLAVAGALLIGGATVAGAWLARRHAARRELCFGAAAGALLVIAGLHLLPDAWSAARQTALPA